MKTGITFGTFDMASSARLYSAILLLSIGPVIRTNITKSARTTVTRQRSGKKADVGEK